MKVAKKIVLNSGGFDSTVLLGYVREMFRECELHSLFFNYGQLSLNRESVCSKANADRFGYEHHEISIPKFSWTNSDFYKDNGFTRETQYLEYRNLVFLSYAFSLAQSIGADEIYLAILHCPENEHYSDCSNRFFFSLNGIDPKIKVVTPFSEFEKDFLAYKAFTLGISPSDFHSCDVPNSDGSPCGKCPDCLSLEYINDFLTLNSPNKAFLANDFNAFRETYLLTTKQSGRELRVLLNNDCQLSCPHCFYGFDNMVDTPLSIDEWSKVVEEALSSGYTSLHFGGKEPLFDNRIFNFLEMVKHAQYATGKWFSEIGIVTNGITFSKYARLLKEHGVTKMYFSVDEVLGKEHLLLHKTVGLYEKNIRLAFNLGFEVEIFIDLHENNWEVSDKIVSSLEDLGVRKVYFRTVRSVGKGSSLKPLSLDKVNSSLKSLYSYKPRTKDDFSIEFNMGIYYTYRFLRSEDYHLAKDLIEKVVYYQDCQLTNTFTLFPELYCGRYSDTTTVTPDGYVLGCGCEVALSDYPTHSAGNVRCHSLEYLVQQGVEKTCNANYEFFATRSYPDCLCSVEKI